MWKCCIQLHIVKFKWVTVLNDSLYSTLEHDSADPNDYLDVANHEVDRQEELEYEVWLL